MARPTHRSGHAPDSPNPKHFHRWLFHTKLPIWSLLVFLALMDLMLIALHFWAVKGGSSNPLLRVDRDRSYAEFFQAVKYIYAAVLLLGYCLARRRWQLVCWSLLFGYFVIDDLLMVHEYQGAELIAAFGLEPAFGWQAQDFGELIVAVAVAVVAGIPLLLGYLFGTHTTRWVSRVLVVLVAVLAFFGVVVDMAHSLVAPLIGGFDWMAVLEDGGEMVGASLLLLFVFRLAMEAHLRYGQLPTRWPT